MSIAPLPANIEDTLPNPRTPWHASPQVFPRLQFDPAQKAAYTRSEITPKDPEWNFVVKYFDHDAPTNPLYRCIRRVFCIHNPSSTGQFESKIPAMEQESQDSFFAPSWHKEDCVPQRTQAFQRWQDSVQPFSPFFVTSASGRKDIYSNVKIVPLWHGSTAEKCDSICKTGFTFFGKHDPKDLSNTDVGYFGSGIYFTNSARYATDIYSGGHLMLAWVSMREPFPVVSEALFHPPQEPKDMTLLKGKGAYKKYNAHYVPVISINPANKQCPVYYPCAPSQLPMCDEYTIFQPAQTLARFWVELGQDPATFIPPEPSIVTVGHMLDHILKLLDNPAVQSSDLAKPLEGKTHSLLALDEKQPLTPQDLEFYNCTQKLLSDAGVVRAVVQTKLKQLMPAPAPQKAAAAVVVKPGLPPLAFGALKWEQYFGIKVAEPSLPADIDKILASACPFFSGKKVAETHFLTLVPEGMTLEKLESLTLNSKQGSKIGLRGKADKYVKLTLSQLGKTSSGRAHWVLMPNDVIPNSRNKTWADQQVMAASYKSQGYELLSLIDGTVCFLLEHVQTGKRFYSDSPYTYTRCSEQVKLDSSQWPAAIGGFASGGLIVGYDYGDASESRGLGVARVRLEAQ